MSSLLCNRIGEFNLCVNDVNLDVASCASNLKSVPTLEYYICQCTAYTKLTACYSFCPESKELREQLQSQATTKDYVCSAVDAMKQQGMTLSASKTTSPFPSTPPTRQPSRTSVTTAPLTSTTTKTTKEITPSTSIDTSLSTTTKSNQNVSPPRATIDMQASGVIKSRSSLVSYLVIGLLVSTLFVM